MKDKKVKRFVFLPPELDAWLEEEAENDMRTPSQMIAKILDVARNEKARSVLAPQALIDVNPNS